MTTLWLTLRRGLSLAVLATLWLLVITPVALLSRLVRGDVLQRTIDPQATTYWREPEAHTADTLWGFLRSNGKIWMLPVIVVLLSLGLLLAASESSLAFAFLYPLF